MGHSFCKDVRGHNPTAFPEYCQCGDSNVTTAPVVTTTNKPVFTTTEKSDVSSSCVTSGNWMSKDVNQFPHSFCKDVRGHNPTAFPEYCQCGDSMTTTVEPTQSPTSSPTSTPTSSPT